MKALKPYMLMNAVTLVILFFCTLILFQAYDRITGWGIVAYGFIVFLNGLFFNKEGRNKTNGD